MIVIKPKMLRGKLNIDSYKNGFLTTGAILGALGGKVEISTSKELEINSKQKYFLKLLEDSGCIVNLTNNTLNVVQSGLSNPLTVDACKCREEIFLITVYLCFLKGDSKLFNINKINSSVRDKIFELIGDLKKIGAEITVDSNEILFFGKQTFNAFEVSAYSSFEIFRALCIVAHRCEGSLSIKNVSGISVSEYNDLMYMLLSLGADITEKDDFIKMRKNIILTGMSGAGKSYIGKAVADKLGLDFFDSDEEFEKEENANISDVFTKNKEEYFRERESDIIKRLSRKSNSVISTGGGSVLEEENVSNLKNNGIVFYLERDIDVILDNVDKEGKAPLKGGKNAIRKLFKQRKSFYENSADYIISNNDSPEETIEKICKIYEEYKSW